MRAVSARLWPVGKQCPAKGITLLFAVAPVAINSGKAASSLDDDQV